MTRSKPVITIVFEYEVLTVEHRIRHEGMGVYIDEDEIVLGIGCAYDII